MIILVDTHILLWALENSKALSSKQKELLKNTDHEKWVSRFSFMEIAIKMRLGKLECRNTSLEEIIKVTKKDGFQILPLKDEHIITYLSLPVFENHKDPFDRFIISTAKFEGMEIMTSDEKFNLYSSFVKII